MNQSVYVMRESVREFSEVIAPDKLKGADAFKKYPLAFQSLDGVAYVQANREYAPAWAEELRSIVPGLDVDRLKNRSSSAVLVMRLASGRLVATTYGHGHHALANGSVDPTFGLEAALRLVSATGIRSLDTTAIGRGGMQRRLISPTAEPVERFASRSVEDVKRIEGVPADKSTFTRISGSRAIRFSSKHEVSQLPDLCERLFRAASRKVPAAFQRVRPFERIDDPALEAKLWRRLSEDLKGGQHLDLGIALPDMDDYGKEQSFDVRYRGSSIGSLTWFDANEVVSLLTAEGLDDLSDGNLCVHALSADGSSIRRLLLRELWSADITVEPHDYALSNGRWFRLSANANAVLNDRLASIPRSVLPARGKSPVVFPGWDGREHESVYNTNAAEMLGKHWTSLDKQTKVVVDHKVEICDLFSCFGHLVHVKRWSSSQEMSALTNQAKNSADFLIANPEFRNAFLEIAQERFGTLALFKDLRSRFEPSRLTVVLAILVGTHRKIPESLPFFSRHSLAEACEHIRGAGYQVAIVRNSHS